MPNAERASVSGAESVSYDLAVSKMGLIPAMERLDDQMSWRGILAVLNTLVIQALSGLS